MKTLIQRALLLALAVLAFDATDAYATHFRYGTIQWRAVNGQPNQIQFTVRTAWRRSYFGTPGIGATINPGNFCFRNGGTCVSMISTVTSISTTEDWVEATFTATHVYPASNAVWTANHSGCCRISSLTGGNADTAWNIETTVPINMASANSSPTSGAIPIVRLPVNVPGATFALAATDPDGDILSYGISSTAQSGLANSTPAGLSINSTTGQVTFNTIGKSANSLWAIQFRVSDNRGASIPVDVIIMLVNVTSQPPTMLINNSASAASFTVTVGQQLTFSLQGTDPESGVLSLVASGIPAGATINPSWPVNLASGQTSTFSWTPTAAQVGSHTLSFAATDNTGLQDTNSATIVVATVAAPTTTTVTVGSDPSTFGQPVTLTAVVQSSGTPPGSVQFYVDGLLNSTKTLAALNSTQSTASLTVAGLGVGAHTVLVSYGGATSGGTTYQSSSSSPTGFTVAKSTTATSVTSSLNPSTYGQAVTFTATVYPIPAASSTPAGTIQFQQDGSDIGGPVTMTAGTAQVTVASMTAAVHTITAIYSADSGFEGSTGILTQTVKKAPASVTPNAATKVYGDADPVLTGALAGFLASDGIIAAYSRTAGEAVGGAYTIAAALGPAGVLGNYEVTYDTAVFTISKRSASVTPDTASKTYGSNDPGLTGTLTGFLPADNAVATYSRTAGEAVGGVYTISATLSPVGVLGNYDVTYNTAAFSITKRPAAVVPSAANKVYGDGDPTLTGTLDGFLASDNVTATYTRTAGELVGGTYTIGATLTPAGALANYNITYGSAAFSITKRPASVTPAAAGKTYGDIDPVLGGTLTGFLPADNVVATYSRTAGEAAGGAYTISATLSPAAVLSNYDVTSNTGAFSILKRSASVTPSANGKTYGDPDPTLSGTMSGFLPADGVTASYSRNAGESVTGTYTITATLSPAGVLGNYQVTYNTSPFTITKRAATATANAASKTYGNPDPPFTGTLSGFLSADGVTATYSRNSGESVAGAYTITATLGPAAVLANYQVTYTTAPFTIAKKAASVTPNPATKVYGTPDPPFTGTLAGFLPADAVVAAYIRTPGEQVTGTYAIGATLAPAALVDNYLVTYNTAPFTITKATPGVSVVGGTFVHDGNPHPATGVVTGVGGVTIGVPVFTYDGNTAPPVAAGIYTVQAYFAGNDNYNPASASTVITINEPPAISLTGPTGPLAVGALASLSAAITDAATGDAHTCTFAWDDGTSNTTVAKTGTGNGTCATTHTYKETGVFTVTVTVTDDDTLSTTQKFQYVVVYDPTAGFVTGGGWISSAAGSYVADPALSGKATFGFVSKYKKGMTVPTGETEFQFQVANFRFHSAAYEWLVVSGARAQYKGSGAVNGAGDFGFLLTATDGQVAGGGGVDKFRMKIWDKATGLTVYDNVIEGAEDLDNANPQALGGGSIVIHAK